MCQVSILRDTHRGFIIQTVKSRMSIISEKVHRLDPPVNSQRMGVVCRNNVVPVAVTEPREPSLRQRGAVAEWVRASTGDRTIDGSTPTAGDFEFGTLAIPLLCQCLSDETLKAVGPFYLVSMPGEVKDPTSAHWNVSLVDSTSHSKSPECEYAALDAALHRGYRLTAPLFIRP